MIYLNSACNRTHKLPEVTILPVAVDGLWLRADGTRYELNVRTVTPYILLLAPISLSFTCIYSSYKILVTLTCKRDISLKVLQIPSILSLPWQGSGASLAMEQAL